VAATAAASDVAAVVSDVAPEVNAAEDEAPPAEGPAGAARASGALEDAAASGLRAAPACAWGGGAKGRQGAA
jgi:hypothetical protein